MTGALQCASRLAAGSESRSSGQTAGALGALSPDRELTGACAAGYNKSLITLRFFLQVQVGSSSGDPV